MAKEFGKPIMVWELYKNDIKKANLGIKASFF